MAKAPTTGSMRNWNPGAGGADAESKKAKLFSTEAKDHAESINGTNELKEHVGKGGTPKGPFGMKGREF